MTEQQKHAQVAALISGRSDRNALRDMLGLGQFERAVEMPTGMQPALRHTRTTSRKVLDRE